MSAARSIAINFASLSVAEVFSKIVQFILFILIARAFGPVQFGIFGFAIAFATIVSIIADFGIGIYLVREISRNREKASELLGNALFLKILLAVSTFLVAGLYFWAMGFDRGTIIVSVLMILFFVIQSITDVFYSIFRAFEKMHFDALIKIVRMILLVIAVAYLMRTYQSLIITTLAFPLVEVVMIIVAASICVMKFVPISFKATPTVCKRMLKNSALFCLSIVFGSLLAYISTVILQHVRGAGEVGPYAAAYTMLLGVVAIPLMMGNAIFPVFSRYHKNRRSLSFAFSKIYYYMLIMGLPLSVGIFWYADPLIRLLYGSGYEQAILATKILCWFVALRFINVIAGVTLAAVGRQKQRVLSQGVVVAINIVLNLVLIPLYGFIGAGIATIAAESFFLLMYNFYLRKYGISAKLLQHIVKPGVAVGLMTLAIWFVPNMFLGAMLGALTYCIGLVVLKALGKEDVSLIMRLIKKKDTVKI